ncbi:MAG: ClpXP protease specificity-enhancing factor [Candidatus Thiodiazotropha sp.]
MSSNRPYLIRAFYEWVVDNGKTPYLMVNAEYPNAVLPLKFVENGRIILNIDPSAISRLELANDWISFSARFAGVLEDIMIPPGAVMGIYAKENGQGMLFPDEETDLEEEPEDDPDPTPSGRRPALKIVK